MKNFNRYFIAILTSANLLLSPFGVAGEKVDEMLDGSGATAVNIENLSGKVTIIGWDKASVTVKGELDDEAERLIFEKIGKTITIKVEVPNRASWTSEGSELVIHLPENLRVNFESISSDVELENLSKNVSVKTISGNIKATRLSEHIELSSVSGNISTESLNGKIDLASVSGDINDVDSKGRLQLQAVSGVIKSSSQATEVYVNNVSGDNKLKLDKIDELKVSSVSGDSNVNLHLNINGVIKASNVSGTILLDFQDNVAADFRLRANAGGDLINKLTKQKAEKAKHGPRAKLYFQTGDASSSVRVSTVSGDVIVK